LKIVGGRMTDAGSYAAYITKVKKGSIADTVGHLRAGMLRCMLTQHAFFPIE
jgi:regulating synaptic membrane exocytosis protein 1/regulating synaptic membrane exocytosis protein 2